MHLYILFTLQCVSPFMHWLQRYIMIDSARQEKRIVLVLQLLFNQSKLTVKLYMIVCENSEIGNIFLFFPSPGHTFLISEFFVIHHLTHLILVNRCHYLVLCSVVVQEEQDNFLSYHCIKSFINCKCLTSPWLIPAHFLLIGSTTGLLRSLYEWCGGRGGAKASTSSCCKARMWRCDNWRFRWWPVQEKGEAEGEGVQAQKAEKKQVLKFM